MDYTEEYSLTSDFMPLDCSLYPIFNESSIPNSDTLFLSALDSGLFYGATVDGPYDSPYSFYEHSTSSDQYPSSMSVSSCVSPAQLHLSDMSPQPEPLFSSSEENNKAKHSRDKRNRGRAMLKLKQASEDLTRQHQCTECGRRFKRRADLSRHLKRHQGIQDYPCSALNCPLPPDQRSFFRADARQRHWMRSSQCEREFYDSPQGILWLRKNKNRAQKPKPRRYTHDEDDDSDDSYNDA